MLKRVKITNFRSCKSVTLDKLGPAMPPRESDGSLAHNCLCWLTPIWGDVDEEVDADAVVQWFRRRRAARV